MIAEIALSVGSLVVIGVVSHRWGDRITAFMERKWGW